MPEKFLGEKMILENIPCPKESQPLPPNLSSYSPNPCEQDRHQGLEFFST